MTLVQEYTMYLVMTLVQVQYTMTLVQEYTMTLVQYRSTP